MLKSLSRPPTKSTPDGARLTGFISPACADRPLHCPRFRWRCGPGLWPYRRPPRERALACLELLWSFAALNNSCAHSQTQSPHSKRAI